MKWLIEKSRYLSLIGVFGLLAGSLLAFFFGAYKTLNLFHETVLNYASEDYKLIALFDVLDIFLVAVALLVISTSLYELFIGDLNVPDWMLVHNLSELKAKFGFVIIPVIAVKFLQKLLASESALDTLYYGIAVALVSVSLTVFNYVGEKEKVAELEMREKEDRPEKRAEDV
ncbi:MAG: YqhA family protein [Pyrinomonadaceae bacterium]|nr:YqhA family protein [Pyrinomonadaceae bacterium]